VDVLCTGSDDLTLYTAPRVHIRGTHGTGCTFSAALTAALALGAPLHEAVALAKQFVTRALQTARPAGRHFPLNFQGFPLSPLRERAGVRGSRQVAQRNRGAPLNPIVPPGTHPAPPTA
jgi:pyridoxal/pyridoxine/pyridoxamine kinase